ncbi:MAG: hypothetical protein JWL70_1009, partial [Acidimicrobiia bacterium]|nr:hypothetical protein [Acidimicrobiia bacterium]
PQLVANDVINTTLTVDRVITIGDIIENADFNGPEFAAAKAMAGIRAGMGSPLDLPIAVEVKNIGKGYRLGTGLQLRSGKAVGRQLYATEFVGDVFFCDGRGEANILRFTDVLPGDEVLVDNRKFLAYHYWARHHILDELVFDSFRLDGKPIYPQHVAPDQSPLMGVAYSGQYKGKLMWVHHTHDSSLWPPQGVVYSNAVLQAQGEAGAAERFRLRWTEHAEHVPPFILKSPPGRAINTWLVDYLPVIEQSLKDLVDWVENGVDPQPTAFEYHDGLVTLPATAAERGGIQPVVTVTANGAVLATVAVGEAVTLEVQATMPAGAGTLISAAWDFDGTGTFPFRHPEVDGAATSLTLSTTHTYDRPGTYFATALVESHRDGDVAATSRRIPNMAQARIIVS